MDDVGGTEGGPAASRPDASGEAAAARRILDELGEVVLGQRAALRQMMVVLLAGGHGLLEGVPGTAKTLAIRALALLLDVRFDRIQFTPDLMPTDITGVNVLDEVQRAFEFRPGPVFTDLLLADEINRAPAKTQAALLEAMQEGQVTVDDETRPLPDVFTVFASQNPVEHEGTYPLPEAQLDRFLLKIDVGYPPEDAERSILDLYAGGFHAARTETYGLEPIADEAGLLAMREAVRGVHVASEVRDYVTDIVRATREDPSVALGASPRAGVALFLAARAEAFVAGRDYVTPDDVKRLAAPALRHRLTLTPDALVDGRTADARIAGVLERVEAPGAPT
jgi:MoxR-like ATPase